MSGNGISIARLQDGRAFAVSVASWPAATARTMNSPRPWSSSAWRAQSQGSLDYTHFTRTGLQTPILGDSSAV
jgi:hypothetical protein